ncbi:MAG: hypothetical protein II942_04160 [Alphaproteobacteria bacterium]|nr:hypothetical protein [Alphaproteobacteria bacterium]
MKIFRIIITVLLFVCVGIGVWYFWKTRDDEVFETHEEAQIAVSKDLWDETRDILYDHAKLTQKIKKGVERNPNAVENMLALNLLEGMLTRDLHQLRLKYLAEMDVVDEVFLSEDEHNKVLRVEDTAEDDEEYLQASQSVVVPADEWEQLTQEYADWNGFLSAMSETLTRSEDEITFSPEDVGLLTERHDDLQASWDSFMEEYLSLAYEHADEPDSEVEDEFVPEDETEDESEYMMEESDSEEEFESVDED